MGVARDRRAAGRLPGPGRQPTGLGSARMILVDPPSWTFAERVWSHLASDTSYAELHAFAERVGLHPYSYDGDHYDVPSERYGEVVAAGATPVTARTILDRLRAAGLRYPKRRGDRPVPAAGGLSWLHVPHRLDLLCSRRPPPEASTVAAATFVIDDADRILLVPHERRGGWEPPGGWREPGESPAEGAAREVQEETGLRLRLDALLPVGYERVVFTGEPPPGRWRRPYSHIALFAAQVDAVEDVDAGAQWVARAVFGTRCQVAPWWPLVGRLDLPWRGM